MNNSAPLNASLHLAPAHLSMVQAILADHIPLARVLAFGSRAAGTPRKYSDLDLASMVQAILADHIPLARVLAFGSRAAGTPRKYSDLDLAIIQPEPLTLRVISRLKNAFEDSDLPICVDVVDWNQADDEFKAMVSKQGMVELQR